MTALLDMSRLELLIRMTLALLSGALLALPLGMAWGWKARDLHYHKERR